MTNVKQEPKEWWIKEPHLFDMEDYGCVDSEDPKDETFIHVVEYSALMAEAGAHKTMAAMYAKALERIAVLESALRKIEHQFNTMHSAGEEFNNPFSGNCFDIISEALKGGE